MLENKINDMYLDRLDSYDLSVEGVKEAIVRDIFSKMNVDMRIELMKKANVYDRGNIREKTKDCVEYILTNILDKSVVSTEGVSKKNCEEFTDFLDTSIGRVSVIKALNSKPSNGEIESVLNNKLVGVMHSKTVKEGSPLDVVKVVLKGRGLETLDVLYLDKDRNIITCVKSGKKESISLSSEDFENTRIILDLLSIEYK